MMRKSCSIRDWRTHVQDILVYNKCCTTCLDLATYANLTNAAVAAEQFIQILSRRVVRQVLDEQDPVGARGKFRL